MFTSSNENSIESVMNLRYSAMCSVLFDGSVYLPQNRKNSGVQRSILSSHQTNAAFKGEMYTNGVFRVPIVKNLALDFVKMDANM